MLNSFGVKSTALFRAACGTLLCLCTAVACSSGEDETPATPIAQANVVTELSKAACAVASPCCSAEGLTFDRAECEMTVARRIQGRFSGVDLTLLVYDGDAAGRCRNELTAAVRACKEPTDAVTPSCTQITKGTSKLGGDCRDWLECEQTTNGRVGCVNYRCTTLASNGTGLAGDDCDFHFPVCSPATLRCDGDTEQCERAGTENESCMYEWDCADQFICDRVVSRCKKPLPVGAECSDDDQCESQVCRDEECRARSAAYAGLCVQG